MTTATEVSSLNNYHPLVSWRSVIAGFAVTLLTMVGLIALGMAFGGIGLDDGTSLQSAGLFTGIWFVASSLVSLGAGSYFAARISKFQTARLGSAQGLLIAAIFFTSFMWMTLSTIGWAGRMSGQAVGGAATVATQGANQAAQNPILGDIVEDALGDLNIPAERIQLVVTGVATRLLRGDTESAQSYLSRQTGTTPEEAQIRMFQLRTQVDQFMVQAREKAASALKATGWTLFLIITFGSIAAVLGGAFGSRTNLYKPLERRQRSASLKPATV